MLTDSQGNPISSESLKARAAARAAFVDATMIAFPEQTAAFARALMQQIGAIAQGLTNAGAGVEARALISRCNNLLVEHFPILASEQPDNPA
jgi:hypothetical protein